ncbi:hypothetical protein N2152v2_004872 [Parachlorella kessleri]
MQPNYSPFGCDVSCVAFPQEQLAKDAEHICSRACCYSQVCGNLYVCSTSGTTHICDQNCNQRIYYDNYRTICRLSKRLFNNTEASMSEGLRKRGSDAGDLDRLGSTKRSLSEQDWESQQAIVDAASANAAWCKSEVAAWQQVQQQQAH